MLLNYLLVGLTLLIVVLAIMVLLHFIRDAIPQHIIDQNSDMTTPIHSAMTTIYAVLLSFIVVNVWTQYTNTSEAVNIEANTLTEMINSAAILPDSSKTLLLSKIKEYCESVVNAEWENLKSGGTKNIRSDAYSALWTTVGSIPVYNVREHEWLQRSYDRLNTIDINRNKRFFHAKEAVPMPMWIFLIWGGIVCVFSTVLFDIKHRVVQLIFTGLLTSIIVFILYIIMDIDRPFNGLVQVGKEPFLDVIQQMMK